MTDSSESRSRYAFLRSPILLLALGLLAAFAVPCLNQKSGDWEKVYIAAATRLRSGGDVFDLLAGFVHPPFAAFLAVPFSFFNPSTERVLWWLANTLAATVVITVAWRLPGNTKGGLLSWKWSDHLIFWFGFLASIGFLFDSISNQQVDLILAAFVLGGCSLVSQGKPLSGGFFIGLGAAAKCTPLLFVPYFIWMRQWRAALAVLVSCLGMNYLPDVLYPPPNNEPRLHEWANRCLPSVTSQKVDPGIWFSGIQYNHSLAGIAKRLFTAERVSADGTQFGVPKENRVSPGTLKLGVYAACLALSVLAALSTIRRSGRSEPMRDLAAEFGMVLTLMLLFSPMSSKPHFCTLLLPAWVVARSAVSQRDVVLILLMLLAIGSAMLTNKDLVGARVYDIAMWYGSVTADTLLLFFGCWWVRLRNSAEAKPVST